MFTSVYSIDGTCDYFYGTLAPSTGCLKVFDLMDYKDGMLLMPPERTNPTQIVPFVPQEKLFSTFSEFKRWGKISEVMQIGHLNQAIEHKHAGDMINRKNEGFMDASQVLYVARAGNFRAHGFDYHGALRILKVIMEYDYLWINIRVKGGAYGCMNGYMKNGDTYFVSYRDPNLEKTNEIYDGIPAYIEQFTADERDMTKYIIGTISDMDVPMNPSTKGDRSMAAYLQNISYEEIQKERDQVIGATQEDIRGLRDMIASVLAENNLCVVGNEETLQASEGMFGEVKHLNESER